MLCANRGNDYAILACIKCMWRVTELGQIRSPVKWSLGSLGAVEYRNEIWAMKFFRWVKGKVRSRVKGKGSDERNVRGLMRR
jgi:hypothetical protein